MSTIPQLPPIRQPIQSKDGTMPWPWIKWFQDLQIKTANSLNLVGQLIGEIAATAKIQGRIEGIGTTTQHITSTGALASTDNIAADGTGSPLTGGRRGFIGLDTNSRLASSFYLQPVDAASLPTSATGLSNNGADTIITVPGQTFRFGFGNVTYSAGSVDPGVTGTFYVYADDPSFAGGVVTYHATTDGSVAKTGAITRVFFGAITTSGAPSTGGGSTGGTTPGGNGGSRGANL